MKRNKMNQDYQRVHLLRGKVLEDNSKEPQCLDEITEQYEEYDPKKDRRGFSARYVLFSSQEGPLLIAVDRGPHAWHHAKIAELGRKMCEESEELPDLQGADAIGGFITIDYNWPMILIHGRSKGIILRDRSKFPGMDELEELRVAKQYYKSLNLGIRRIREAVKREGLCCNEPMRRALDQYVEQQIERGGFSREPAMEWEVMRAMYGDLYDKDRKVDLYDALIDRGFLLQKKITYETFFCPLLPIRKTHPPQF